MSALRGAALVVGLGAAVLWTAPAAHAGDAANGGQLARQWCAACHLVEAAQTSASDAAPSFLSIARDPAKTRAGLEVWLADPHPPMPNLSLSNQEIDDLITYIQSLSDGQ